MSQSPYRPTYTARERALFTEIAEAERVLAEALGFQALQPGDPGYSPHHTLFSTGEHTIVSLAAAAAMAIAVARGNATPDPDTESIRTVAESWACNIDNWLHNGDDGATQKTPDYADGFADGWRYAASALRSLFNGVEGSLPGPVSPQQPDVSGR